MPWLDLEEGIAEEFASAAARSDYFQDYVERQQFRVFRRSVREERTRCNRTRSRHEDRSVREERTRCNRTKSRHEERKRLDAKLRALRVAPAPIEALAPDRTEICALCGGVIEWRPGCRVPVHRCVSPGALARAWREKQRKAA